MPLKLLVQAFLIRVLNWPNFQLNLTKEYSRFYVLGPIYSFLGIEGYALAKNEGLSQNRIPEARSNKNEKYRELPILWQKGGPRMVSVWQSW